MRVQSTADSVSKTLAILILAALTPMALAQPDFPLEAMSAGNIEDLSEKVNTFQDNAGDDLRWQRTITRVGSDYLRIRFSNISNPESEAFQLTIKNGDGVIVLDYSAQSMPTEDFWTPVIFGDRLLIQVRSDTVPTSLSFDLDKIAFQADGGGWLSIVDDDEREPIINYVNDRDIWDVSRSVAKLSFFKGGSFFVCTGFMITEDRMMTNHHCVATADVCATTQAIFGFEKNDVGAVETGEQFACNDVIAADFEKDYAILELAGSPGNSWGTLKLDSNDIGDSDEVFIIQHPAGEPKQISKINCKVDGAIVNGRGTDTDMAHVCDTLGGSSGSPVFSDSNTVIGLHHFGVGQAAFWNKNRAVRMKLIMDEIGAID